jgi:bacillithiol system protein YtxJ
MNWIKLSTPEDLEKILQSSYNTPQVIYKHSTRCSISSVIKNRLERSGIPGTLDFHFLDLLANRSLSNKIATDLTVYHESPQVLVIKNGECIYDESHMAIRMENIIEQAA